MPVNGCFACFFQRPGVAQYRNWATSKQAVITQGPVGEQLVVLSLQEFWSIRQGTPASVLAGPRMMRWSLPAESSFELEGMWALNHNSILPAVVRSLLHNGAERNCPSSVAPTTPAPRPMGVRASRFRYGLEGQISLHRTATADHQWPGEAGVGLLAHQPIEAHTGGL